MTRTHFEQMSALSARRDRMDRFKVVEQARMTHLDLEDSYRNVQSPLAGLLEMADLTSSDTGVLNRLFGGQMVWSQLNEQTPAFGALPKTTMRPGVHMGWRAKTAFASTGKGGQSEGTVPAAVESTYQEITPDPKEHSTQMRVSGMQQALVGAGEDAYGALVDIQSELAVEHSKEIERALTEDIDTTAGNNVESYDRLAASSANQGTVGWTAGDEDIHNIDRSADTWANGQQSAAASNRAFELSLLDDVIKDVRDAGGSPTYIMTHASTTEAITDLLEPRARYDFAASSLQAARQGDAEGIEGHSINPMVSHYRGLPILESDQVQEDGIGRIYVNDISNPTGASKPRTGFDVLTPTRVYAAGETTGTPPQGISFVGDSLLAVTRGELVSQFYAAQGQVRDLSAP